MKLLPTLLLASLVATVSIGQDSRPGAESTSRPSGYDLRISQKARALIVEAKHTTKGKMLVRQGANDIDIPVDSSWQAKWLDECAEVIPPRFEDKRTFIEVRKTENGRIRDPGLEGVTMLLINDGDTSRVEVVEPRQALKTEMNKQLLFRSATGLFAELPEDAAVGASFTFRGLPLVATLLDIEGELSAYTATLTLDHVDPAKNRAVLTGNVRFSETVKKDLSFTAKYSAAIALEIDLAAREMVKVTLKGQSTVAEGSLSAEVAFDCEATVKPATNVAAIKSKKPTFRENVHRLLGAEMKLPSCWIVSATDDTGATVFADTRTSENLLIEIFRFGEDQNIDPQSNDFIAGFMNSLKKQDPDPKVFKSTFPIGKGLSFELKKDDGKIVRGFVASVGKALLRVIVLGTPDAVQKVHSEVRALANSLKKA